MGNYKNIDEYIEHELHLSEFAWWDWEIPHNKVTFNDLKVKWLGYDPKDFQGGGFDVFTSLLHPEDYERAMEAMRQYLSGNVDLYKIDYRIRTSSGDYKWYMDRGITINKDKAGRPIRMRGIVVDLGNIFSEEIKKEKMIEIMRKAVPFKKVSDKDFMTVCCNCKRLKINNNEFVHYDGRLDHLLDVRISHGLCPECFHSLYPELETEEHADSLQEK
jgi:hypothetical protein